MLKFKYICKFIYLLIRRISIFKRLLAGFLLVIVIPNILLINFIFDVVENEFYNTGINYVYQNLDVTTQNLFNCLKKYEQICTEIERDRHIINKIVSSEIYLEEGNQEQYLKEKEIVNEYLYEKAKSFNTANFFILSDTDFFEPISANSHSLGGQIISIDNFKKSDTYCKSMLSPTQINWINTKNESDMYLKRNLGTTYLANYITLTYKVYDENNTIKYLIVINIHTSEISGLATINKLYNQDLFLIDQDGIITYLSPYFNYINYPNELWEKLIEQKDEVLEYKINNNYTLFVTQPLQKNNWTVVSIISKKRLLQSAFEIRELVFFLIVITIILSLFISMIVTFSISFPLKRLKKAMSLFAKEDFYTEYKDEGNDQIAEVSNIFNGMVKRIRRLVSRQIQDELAIKEEKLKQKEMYVNALQMQINPHFLYNMLDLIRWKTIHLEQGNGKVSKMINGFSNMLKYNIKLGEGYATIKEELEYIKKYLNLIELLYEKHITLNISFNELPIEDIYVNKLLFQPILENTIVHGKIHTVENPLISINIEAVSEMLLIQISNNGKCIEKNKLEYINKYLKESILNYGSVGLKNVNERIRLLFGEQYGLNLCINENKTNVIINLPIKNIGGLEYVSFINSR